MSKFESRNNFFRKFLGFVAEMALALPQDHPHKELFLDRAEFNLFYRERSDGISLEGLPEEDLILGKIINILSKNIPLEVSEDYQNFLRESLSKEAGDEKLQYCISNRRKAAESISKKIEQIDNANNDSNEQYVRALASLSECKDKYLSAIKFVTALNIKFSSEVPENFARLNKDEFFLESSSKEKAAETIGNICLDAIRELLKDEEFRPAGLKNFLLDTKRVLNPESNLHPHAHHELLGIVQEKINSINELNNQENLLRKREERRIREESALPEILKTEEEKIVELVSYLQSATTQTGELNKLSRLINRENINAINTSQGNTPLSFAVKFNDHENVRNFINLGAEITPKILTDAVNIRENNRLVLRELLVDESKLNFEILKLGVLEAIKLGKKESLSLILESSIKTVAALPGASREPNFFKPLADEIAKRERSKNNKREAAEFRGEVESFKKEVSQEVKKSKKFVKNSAKILSKKSEEILESGLETQGSEPPLRIEEEIAQKSGEQELKKWVDEMPATWIRTDTLLTQTQLTSAIQLASFSKKKSR